MQSMKDFAERFTPSEQEVHDNPKTILTSHHPWDPVNVEFDNNKHSMEEEIERVCGFSSINTKAQWQEMHNND